MFWRVQSCKEEEKHTHTHKDKLEQIPGKLLGLTCLCVLMISGLFSRQSLGVRPKDSEIGIRTSSVKGESKFFSTDSKAKDWMQGLHISKDGSIWQLFVLCLLTNT